MSDTWVDPPVHNNKEWGSLSLLSLSILLDSNHVQWSGRPIRGGKDKVDLLMKMMGPCREEILIVVDGPSAGRVQVVRVIRVLL